jgi:hypothetical protein
MLRINDIHPDSLGELRVRPGEKKLNGEWVEFINVGTRSIDINKYFLVNSTGEGFSLILPNKNSIIVAPFQSVLVFSGRPDSPSDGPACFLTNNALRLFLSRERYLWDPERDAGYLYVNKHACVQDPQSYIDMYEYKRRAAKVVITGEE